MLAQHGKATSDNGTPDPVSRKPRSGPWIFSTPPFVAGLSFTTISEARALIVPSYSLVTSNAEASPAPRTRSFERVMDAVRTQQQCCSTGRPRPIGHQPSTRAGDAPPLQIGPNDAAILGFIGKNRLGLSLGKSIRSS